MAYAAAVILLGWYPWNVLLLALLQLTKRAFVLQKDERNSMPPGDDAVV
jgi:hypothetical protein